jgi:hypothetical protein
MPKHNSLLIACLATLSLALGGLSGCTTATGYHQADLILGLGYNVKPLGDDTYRIKVKVDRPRTSEETASTYWLYRASTLALDKGYNGFSLLTNINIARYSLPTGLISPEQMHATDYAASPKLENVLQIYIPAQTGPNVFEIEGNIRLLHGPITAVAGKVFDAAKLKAALDPYMLGKHCEKNNVCSHSHRYLYTDDYSGPEPQLMATPYAY